MTLVSSFASVSQASLQDLPDTIVRSTYDRSVLRAGIMHIGVGGFHRAHQARYIHNAIEQCSANEWAIVGVGIMPQDEAMNEALKKQDCLYTLVEQSSATPYQPASCTATIIGSIIEYIWGYQNPEAVFKRMADSAIRLITLTATEGGYYLDEGTGELNVNHPAIQHDLQNPLQPHTIFGYLAEGLSQRYQAGAVPLTLLSCDNMQENGHILKKALLAFCRVNRADLANWIENKFSFPNCMVDRITPAMTAEARQRFREDYQVDDACPVVCEPFMQWVVEDDFCNGRPPLEKVGVLLTHDVGLYEKMKIRLLNGSHSAMAYLGYLCGYHTIHEIARTPEFESYLKLLMDNEVTPLLPEVPGVDLIQYKKSLMERFSNETIKDQTLRICMDGSGKIPKYILPTIVDQLKVNGSIRLLTLCVASWLRFLNGIDEQGKPIPFADPQAERLTKIAQAARENPVPFLELKDIFGELGQSERFVKELSDLLTRLYQHGAHDTLVYCCSSVNK
ncbi:MAG: mannitol dehydrogenase family protein [Pseudomonadota bacterium]